MEKGEKKKRDVERNRRNRRGEGKLQIIAAEIIAEEQAKKALEQRRNAGKSPKDLSNHLSPTEAINRQALADPHPIFGHPSLYKREYCDRAVDSLRQGHSIAGFAGEIGVSAPTVEDWANKYPEFGRAMEIAKAGAVTFWEDQLIKLAQGIGGGAPGRAVAIIFGLKNRAAQYWRDVQVVEETRTVNVTVSSTRDRIRDRLDRIVSANKQITIDGEAIPQTETVSTTRITEREIEHELA